MTGIDIENDQNTLGDVTQILDDADSLYDEDKTFSNAISMLTTYVSNISRLDFVEMIGPLTRFFKLFSDDLNSQNILSSQPIFRDIYREK